MLHSHDNRLGPEKNMGKKLKAAKFLTECNMLTSSTRFIT